MAGLNKTAIAWRWKGDGMGTAWERHGMCESAFRMTKTQTDFNSELYSTGQQTVSKLQSLDVISCKTWTGRPDLFLPAYSPDLTQPLRQEQGAITCLSKRLCATDDYGTINTQKYFKQLQSLTMIT
jgi:hypothetical protein